MLYMQNEFETCRGGMLKNFLLYFEIFYYRKIFDLK